MKTTRLATVLALAAMPALAAFRPPAVPLVQVDPFFSIWSAADRLTDVETTHWTDIQQPISILLEADGKTWRLCGSTPEGIPALLQKGVEVRPTQTVYTFAQGGLAVELKFSTAKLPDNLEVFSRPVTYVTARVSGAQEWKLRAAISPALATPRCPSAARSRPRSARAATACAATGATPGSWGRPPRRTARRTSCSRTTT